MVGKVWSEDETLLAFRLYCLTPFGRIHTGNPQIRQLAELLSRTPDAVAMKMLNLASHDPRVIELGKVGLKNSSKRDAELWDKFNARTSDLYWASEEALKRLGGSVNRDPNVHAKLREFTGQTETLRETPVRRAQRFFRDTVLTAYNNTCAISGVAKAELLNASHIIPWSRNLDRRTDPCNGIALTALHDRAFDRGLISFDDATALLVSSKLKNGRPNEVIRAALLEFEGKHITIGERFAPDPLALAYHREHIYKAG